MTKKYLYFTPLLIVCIYYLYASFYFEIHDFANYYFGSYLLKKGQFSTNVYFPYLFNQYVYDSGFKNLFLSYAPNTPFLAVFFLPFTLLPLGISKLIFNLISIILLIISVIRLNQIYYYKKAYLIILPIIFFIPLKNNLLFGQMYFLLFFLLVEGFIAYKRESYLKMGIFWGLAVSLKVFPVILIGFLIVKKEFKALRWFLICALVLFFIPIVITDSELYKFYFTQVLFRANNGEISAAYVDGYQSVFMFLKRLFIYDKIDNPMVFYNSPVLFKTLVSIFKIILLGILYFITKNQKNSFFVFSLWLFGSLILSPYQSTYILVLLMFIYLSISKLNISIRQKVFCFLMLFIISNSSFLKWSIFPLNYLRLFSIIILLLTLVYYQRDFISYKIMSVILVLGIIAIPFLVNKEEYYESALDYKTHILTFDYKLRNDTLEYYYWNKNGANKKSLHINYKKIDTTMVYIKNKQLFYKEKQLTFDNSNKLKPMVVDNNIIFLSDNNRGVGFYNLCKMPLQNEHSTK